LATVPVIALMGDRGLAPFLITCYVCLGTIPHANVPWSFGPLGRIVVSPAYHRLHHSMEGSDGCNLGIVLTVWDVLAGRARFPIGGAPICRTGLADRPVRTEQAAGGRWRPGVLLAQLAEPFGVPTGGPQDAFDGPGSPRPEGRDGAGSAEPNASVRTAPHLTVRRAIMSLSTRSSTGAPARSRRRRPGHPPRRCRDCRGQPRDGPLVLGRAV
jgi:hypothetical protein